MTVITAPASSLTTACQASMGDYLSVGQVPESYRKELVMVPWITDYAVIGRLADYERCDWSIQV